MSPKKIHLIFSLLILVGAFLRLFQLGDLPAPLHRDEASIGYNAYSLLKIGQDEHGRSWPLNFEAFGEYKLPGLIYLTLPSISLFGLTEFATRLPTALAGILTLPLIYFLTREIGWSKKIALLALALLTFSFWHVHDSRLAFEPTLGLMFSLASFTCWLRARRQPLFFLPALATYFLGALSYNVVWLYQPFLYFLLTIFLAKKFRPHRRWLIFSLSSLVILALIIAFLSSSVNTSRSKTTIFYQPQLAQQADLDFHAAIINGLPSPLARLITFPYLNLFPQFTQGYFKAFDPAFLFATGNDNPYHSFTNIGFGSFNIFLFPPLILGILFLIKKPRSPPHLITLTYLFTSPLFNAVTTPLSTNRLFDFYLALTLVIAIGISVLLPLAHATIKSLRPIFFIWLTLLLLTTILFFTRYFFIYNFKPHSLNYPGVKEMLAHLAPIQDNYDHIYLDNLDLAYIYYAFYLQINPPDLIQNGKRLYNGFNYVLDYGKYHFTAPPLEILPTATIQNILIIKRCTNIPPKTKQEVFRITNFRDECLWLAHSLSPPPLNDTI